MPLPPTLRKRMAPGMSDPLRDSLLQELEDYLKHEGPPGDGGRRRESFSSEENVESFDHEQSGRLEEQIRLSDLQQLQATFSSHRSSRHSEDEDDDDAAEAEGASTGTQGSRVSARA
ncbi:uncharacterized protein LOC144734780 [Lampetra planeri]